ncbi:MAG TPA: nucleotidyltransferase domain-containing protein [Candidatus Hydrogenedentes bacterium]|nr:nucleotidyltransferase domain-containing protein [Candidatus Hydrogenedentota bacterium]
MPEPGDKAILNKIVEVFNHFNEVIGVGLSGSRARDDADECSDFDFVILAEQEVPCAQRRKAVCENYGVEEFPYFDVDHGTCIDDSIVIKGARCEIIWMNVPFVTSYLRSLESNFGCDEFLPGGLLNTVPLFDPEHVIATLKSEVPPYSEERAVYRIKQHLGHAHFHMYVLRWLETAAFRKDYFCFFRHARDLVEDFITCSFALNRLWFSAEKRVIEILSSLDLMPGNVTERLNSIIMHTGENSDLNHCLMNMKGLFREIAAIADNEHPDSGFPLRWE